MGEPAPGDSVSSGICCPHAVAPTVPAFLSSSGGHPVVVPLARVPHHVRCVQLRFLCFFCATGGENVGAGGGVSVGVSSEVLK